MTVGELIAQLQKFDGDMPVYGVDFSDRGDYEITGAVGRLPWLNFAGLELLPARVEVQ